MFGFTPLTRNKKLGFASTSISGQETCPDTCLLKKSGVCYAKTGRLALHWSKANKSWADFLASFDVLPDGFIFRHNQAGDLPGKGNKVDAKKLGELTRKVSRLRAFTYTHKPILPVKGVSKDTVARNRTAIEAANRNGFTINVSCDSLAQVDAMKKAKVKAPLTVVLPSNAPLTQKTKAGHKVIVCPSQHIDGMTCSKCMICHNQKRGFAVGFRAHGTQKKRLDATLKEKG